MKKYLIITYLFFLGFINMSRAQVSSELRIEIRGAITGVYTFTNIEKGQIDNEDKGISKEQTLGFFSVPPTALPGNLEVAAVIANLELGKLLEVGSYKMVIVKDENPIFNSREKLGFMTVVRTERGTPIEEYYTETGTITLSQLDEISARGSFEATLKMAKGTKEITVSGSFVVRL